ncbi:MAG: NAD-dependent epimerase/dehydratase family protein [Bacteroidia bacterium]
MNKEAIQLTNEDCERSCKNSKELSSLQDAVILVTGGTGFIGKWITETVVYLNKKQKLNITLYLLARNVDAFKKDVPHLAKNTFVHFIPQDIRNLKNLPKEITHVIHAAGTPDSREHASKPLSTIETFYKGTNAILEECLRLSNLRKLIHISSNYVYGNTLNRTNGISEAEIGGSNCNSINATYGEAKRISETLCAIYRNQQRLPITIVRPFAFVGPYQALDKPWAINNFIRDGILGESIRILGNENTVRSYLYGSDMAYWLLKILSSEKSNPVYNLGSSSPVSLKDLAKKIASIIDTKTKIVVKSSKEIYSETSFSIPDNSLLEKDFNLHETLNLKEALKRTILWNQALKNY